MTDHAALIAQLNLARNDIGILLAQIDWLQECTGETLDPEDAALVYQIRQTYKDRAIKEDGTNNE